MNIITQNTRPRTQADRLTGYWMRDDLYRHSRWYKQQQRYIAGVLGLLVRDQSSDSRGPSRSVIGRAFYIVAQVIGLAALFALLLLWVVTVDALVNTPEPETRTFYRADGTSYERTQNTWTHDPRSGGEGD